MKAGPKSRLATMFGPLADLTKRPPMVGGAYFIDRDPALFAIILYYLRTGMVHTESLGFSRVMDEAAYFGISGMLEQRPKVLIFVDYGGIPPKPRG